MDRPAKEYIVDFFSKKLSLFGNTPAAVGWSKTGQRLRYECILKLLPLDGHSILDFGCGKGDFYGFLKEKGIKINYTGIDINRKLIETASHIYLEAELLTLDIDLEELPESYDYIISCGVFNLNIQGVKESAEESLKKLFRHTNKTLLFNCLGTHSKVKDTNLIYLAPEELIAAAKKITDSVVIYNDLIEGDLFLLLNRP
ncbi:MAG: class I SAM-dependent methyltransferase [Nitrospirae bacterium]|nr:MAG: class I SAM-dependent methyltransferase [Nitrospirota bacterium]